MRPKLIMAAVVLAAFLAGSLVEGYLKPRMTNAFAGAPSRTRVVAEQVSIRRPIEREAPAVRRHHRSWEREVLIVAGSSAAGAAIGGAAKGGKGAGVGALAGGIGGLIYDLATHNH